MESSGKRSRTVIGLPGNVEINRRCFRCRHCGYKVIPADEVLELTSDPVSKDCLKALIMLAVFIPFEHAQVFVKRLLNLKISKRFLQRVVYSTGKKFSDYFQQPIVADEYAELINDGKEAADLSYCFIDGAMTPVLETSEKTGKKALKYRENKLGLIVNAKDIVKGKSKSGKTYSRFTKKKFVTSLAVGCEPFKNAFRKLATITGTLQSKKIILISDGAEWIKGIYKEVIPNAVRILDWYHAIEHLWNAAQIRFGEKAKNEIRNWVKPIEALLFEGKVSAALAVIKECAQTSKEPTAFWNLYRYYYKNRHAMKYQEFRKKGYFIGSGAIEAANKYIITSRLKLTGCRWLTNNGNAMTWLRCKYFEGDWDSFWEKLNFRDFGKNGLNLALAT